MASPGFFQRQAHARRNTLLLVSLFLVAVVLITLAVCLVGYLVTSGEGARPSLLSWFGSVHGVVTAGTVSGLILLVSLFRWLDLSRGGARVATMVGARAIDPSTRDADERRFRNVVEEMAIASGVPVPQLYVMDHETGINAFVAGYSPGEAVMVVTHGALTQLSRDELQGVVGHEFSHILNGDMRINVRLIAILAGILMIGQIGSHLMHSASFRSSSRSNERAAIGIFGLALLVIGYVGVFFGRLIQAAVSRQREMLADASAVQFTRNPEGIASALFKIGYKGSFLETTSHASDMNHMCFGESARMKLTSLLASHPPIDERINAIEAGMLARLKSRHRDTRPSASLDPTAQSGAATEVTAAMAGFQPVTPRTGQRNLSAIATASVAAPVEPLSSQVGTVTTGGEQFAEALLKQLPATFRELLYTRSGAVQLCYALLIHSRDETDRSKHLAALPTHPLFGAQPDLQDKLIPTLNTLGAVVRFPALELAMPALRRLDPQERQELIQAVNLLVRQDGRVTLFEFALVSFLQRHLANDAERLVKTRFRSYRPVENHLRTLFGLLARAGTADANEANRVYREAMAGFVSVNEDETPEAKVSIRDLASALTHLNGLSPLLKPAIIDACGHCVTFDGEVKAMEYDMLRLVADQLDCPMPPIQI